MALPTGFMPWMVLKAAAVSQDLLQMLLGEVTLASVGADEKTEADAPTLAGCVHGRHVVRDLRMLGALGGSRRLPADPNLVPRAGPTALLGNVAHPSLFIP